jgi:hypothetical protein
MVIKVLTRVADDDDTLTRENLEIAEQRHKLLRISSSTAETASGAVSDYLFPVVLVNRNLYQNLSEI